MRNIFLFIRRYFTFLTFLVLQAVALWFLFTYNRFYRAKGLGAANQVTGWFNSRYNTVEDFFTMKEENRRLTQMNDSLINLLSSNFIKRDTSVAMVTQDSVPFDTLGNYRRYIWRDAQVIYNTVNAEKNYIQINRGSNQGVKDNMGVFSSNGGLVGKVVNVTPDYSQVMSLLHVQSTVDAMVKKTKSTGRILWDAKDPGLLNLTDISKSDSLVKGDSIITGNFSLSYPPGYLIGTVEQILDDKSTNFYQVKIKPAANFSDLQHVMVVENTEFNAQSVLLKETGKKVDEAKKNNTP
jgi:rod shape-determining protein MreC